MEKRWDEQEALEQSARQLAECGEKGSECWVLRMVLDEVIESVGPWWLAHFISTTQNEEAASALKGYLVSRWPAHAEMVDNLIKAASWTKEERELARELGED
jgi:hypothetical protein